jgi:hypothetical protein
LRHTKIGVIDLTTLKQKLDDVRSEEARLSEEKSMIEAELRQAEASELDEERLLDFCRSLKPILAGLDFKGKRQVLREVVDKIAIDGSAVTIFGIITAGPGRDRRGCIN